ncbi:hypothetical protein HZB02_03070 [Candidatus Woesearchaeota archaeon]|nr:hypothetical protein [Candidatus Woesearchaeota archaeon]
MTLSLQPTMREKNRYLVIEVLGQQQSLELLSKAIKASFGSLFGSMETAKANIKILPDSFRSEGRRGIIKVVRHALDPLKASLCLVDSMQVRSLFASGTLKKAKAYLEGKHATANGSSNDGI